MKRLTSLRFRLLAAVLLAVSLTMPFTLWGVYGDAHYELDELFDAQLEQMARMHLAINAVSTMADMPDMEHPYTHKLLVRHTWLDGHQPAIWESEAGLVLPSSLDAHEGFGDITLHERNWRYFGVWSVDRHHHVLIMWDHAIREELASQIAQRVGLLTVIYGSVLAILITLLLSLALRPLRAVVSALRTTDPLQVRLPPVDNLPQELVVVVEAFDTLIGRFRALLERERHFAATAAHELRTPLAGLSAQLQVLAMQTPAAPSALARAQGAVRHLSRLVEHLLLMARMDANQVQARMERVDLHELALETITQVQDLWLHKDISWDIPQSSDACWQAQGDPILLRILLLNLLDNACKHGDACPLIAIRVACAGTQRELTIEDNGSGIPPDWMNLLQQRFVRASTAGTGIGLALVREITLLHGGQLRLDHADLGGLRASVTLPSPPPTA